MTTLSVPNYPGGKGCMGVDMPDGTRYEANNGKVTVEARHAKQLLRSSTGRFGVVAEAVTGFADIGQPGRVCAACGFHAHHWTTECPRCTAPLGEQETAP